MEVLKNQFTTKEECAEGVKQALKRKHRQLQYCYEKSLKDKPDTKGKFTLSFNVLDTGKTSETTLTDTEIDNPDLTKCIERRVKTWKFPKDCPTPVTQPYIFYVE